MEMLHNVTQGVYRVTLSGKFDFSDHKCFREVIQKISDQDIKQIVLDMGQLDYIDSAALGMLLLAHDEANKYKKEIAIDAMAGQVKKTLELACFDEMFVMN